MGLLDIHSQGLAEAFDRQLRNPGPPAPPESFSAWSFLASGAKGPVSGGLETAGSVADLGGLMQRNEEDYEKRRRDRAGIPRPDLPALGSAMRRKADEFAPNPMTASKADQVIHGVTRGVSKAVADLVLLGPVAGPIAFGAEEGNTAAQRLIDEGVDPVTAAKVGAATAVIQGASVAIPAVGTTALKTFGLAAASGPAAFMTQEKLTKDILKEADYGSLADLHDPLDPLGLTLATLIPFAVGGVHVRSLKKRSVEDAVKHIESGGRRFGPDGKLLTSPKGAQGEMQVMPGTATDPGFGVTPARDSSPEELARVGRDYLAAMQNRYGDTDKALAAYNAGPGAVDNAIKAKGEKWLEAMPDETKAYVAKANKLMGEAAAAKGASEPAVVDAARVKITDEAMARSLPDTPTAHADVLRASDEVAAGRVPDVQPVPTTALPEFRAWFGESKVVDDAGAPLVVYHGTGQNVEAFKVGVRNEAGSGSREGGLGVWMTNDAQVASNFADWATKGGYHEGGNVVPVYVSIKKPWEPEKYSEIADLIDRHTTFKRAPYRMMGDEIDYEAARQELRDQGYDGIVLRKTMTDADGGVPIDQYIALDPNQVKSAIGNSGKFDPNSPSLTDPLKPGEVSPRQQAAAAREASSTLPRDDSPTIEPETPKAAKASAEEAGAVDQARLKTLLEERPDMLVKLPGSDETVTVSEALIRAHEEYDAELDFANLLKVAAECALTNGV